MDNTFGGAATPASFTLTATGPTVIVGPAPVAATDASLGAYTLTESTVAGYGASAWGCSGNATPLAGNVLTLTAADAGNTITCSITNTFNAPMLALNKTVINTGGGTATPASFTLSAAGPTPCPAPRRWRQPRWRRSVTTP